MPDCINGVARLFFELNMILFVKLIDNNAILG